MAHYETHVATNVENCPAQDLSLCFSMKQWGKVFYVTPHLFILAGSKSGRQHFNFLSNVGVHGEGIAGHDAGVVKVAVAVCSRVLLSMEGGGVTSKT